MANLDKIKSVVAYLAGKTKPGKVKLFKLMYFADFTAKAKIGHPITGDIYENYTMGPVARTLWKNFKSITDDCVTITEVPTGVIPEQQMTPKKGFTPDLTADEKAVLDSVVEKYGAMTGNQLRDLTHATLPYKATRSGDVVPYGMASYLHYQRPTEADLKAALAKPATAALLNASAERRSRELEARA